MVEHERVARRRDEREDAAPQRAPEPPLLALQRAAGNHAVAALVARGAPRSVSRTLQVRNIDYDPQANKFHHSNIDVVGMLAMLKDTKFEQALTAKEKERLAAIDGANLHADDIPRLAEAIVDHIVPATPAAKHAPRVQLILAAHRPAVEGAIVRNAPKEVSTKEENVFKRVLDKATVKSRAKGAPSQVALADLEAKMSGHVQGLVDSLNSKHDELGQLATWQADPGLDLWTRVSLPLLRDTPHQNRAGWLLAHNSPHPAPALDALTVNWVNGIVATAADPDHAAVTAAFPNPAQATAADVQDRHDIADAIKLRWFNQVYAGAVPNRATRSRLAWKRWADAGHANCPYIEFAASDAGGISRIVWDFVNDRFFIGVHYNWVEGYNPFFQVTGLAATL